MILEIVTMEMITMMIMIGEREGIAMMTVIPEEAEIMTNPGRGGEAEAQAAMMDQVGEVRGGVDQEIDNQEVPGWRKCQLWIRSSSTGEEKLLSFVIRFRNGKRHLTPVCTQHRSQ